MKIFVKVLKGREHFVDVIILTYIKIIFLNLKPYFHMNLGNDFKNNQYLINYILI